MEKDIVYQEILFGSAAYKVAIFTPIENGKYHLRQFAVAPDVQNRGIGKGLQHFAENRVAGQGQHPVTVILHARLPAVGFYEKCDYRVVGEKFLEVGIPHFPMEKTIQPVR